MKKGLKLTVASVMAMSAVTPVAVLANEAPAGPAAAGFYTADGYYSPVQFKNLTKEEKQALLARADLVLVLDEKVYFGKDSIGKSDAELATLAIPVAQFEAENGKLTEGGYGEAPVAELKVESVSAITSTKLEVKFASSVNDTSKATFAVKVGGSTVSFKAATWNEDKTVATLEKTVGKLGAGNYEVTVSGLTETALTGTATVEAEKIASMSLVGDILVQAANGQTGTVALEVLNQYGENIAKTLEPSAFEITVTGANTTALYTKSTGLVTVDANGGNTNTFETEKITSVQLTVAHKSTGTVATKTLTVSPSATLKELTFGEAQLPTGKNLLTADLTAINIPYTAKDQYGNDLDLNVSTDDRLVISDETILAPGDVSFTTDVNGNKVLRIAKFLKAGSVKVTVFSIANGVSFSSTLDVQAAPGAVSAITPAETAKTIAAGSTATVDLVVTDNYGTTLAAKDYVGKSFNITSSNPSVVDNSSSLKINNTVGNANYGKLEIPVVSVATKGAKSTITITDVSTGKQYAQVEVTAGEAVAPSTIEVDGTPSTTLVKGSQSEIKFVVKDQYGNKVASDNSNYKVVLEVKAGSTDYLKLVDGGGNEQNSIDVTNETSVTAKVAAKGAGAPVLVAKLAKTDGTEVDKKEIALNVVANSSTNLTYAIEDISTIYQNADADGSDDTLTNTELQAVVENGLAKEVKISATDSNGTKYVIPSSSIVNMTVNAGGKEVYVQKETSSGKWYIVSGDNTSDKDFTATITATINTDDTVKSITKEVTVGVAAPVAQKLELKDKAAGVSNLTSAKAVNTDYTFAGVAAFTASKADLTGTTDVFVWVTDQYGSYSLTPTVTFVPVDGLTNTDGDTVAISSGTVNLTDNASAIGFSKDNAKFRVVVTAGGQSAFLNFTVVDNTLPAKASSNDVTFGTNTATIVFSEAVKGFAISDITIGHATSATGAKGSDASVTAVSPDADGYATTWTVNLGATGSTDFGVGDFIKVDATKVLDKAGNAAGTTGTVDFSTKPAS